MPETPIRLRNSLTRRVEELVPVDPGNVRMYVCGPTVYDRAHLGNARSAVVFDVLFRLLRHVYGEEHVTYVRNITDIDDKIIARAAETGRSVEDITAETTRWYHEDMDALGCLRPTHEPRATDYLPQMIAMIGALIEGGHAYEAEGHVLFSVSSYGEYGRLSGRSVDDMIAGARIEVAPYKRDPMDFVLWKPSGEGMPGWESPWGRGRPGWHIECSAMARDLLGGEFDIHGGGLDLQFPHHENEIAQSACVGDELARLWVHNEMLMVDGRKMSKSLGNFFTVRDLLDRGVPGEVIRLVLLGTRYSKPMDWTERQVEEATASLRKWSTLAGQSPDTRIPPEILADLLDDIEIHDVMTNIEERYAQGGSSDVAGAVSLLGFDVDDLAAQHWTKPFEVSRSDGTAAAEGTDFRPTISVFGWGELSEELRDSSLALAHKWLVLRRNKDWEQADTLRQRAAEIGIELRAGRSSNGINNASAGLAHSRIEPAEVRALAT